MPKYVPSDVAASLLGVSTSTLRQYVTAHGLGFIKTPGGQKRYDISDIMRVKGGEYRQPAVCLSNLAHGFSGPKATPETKGAIYARMSSKKQEDDLERQITSLQDALQGYKAFKDICLDLSYKHKGHTRLLEQVQGGTIKTAVVAHKDGLESSHFLCQSFDTILYPHFNAHAIVQGTLNKIVKRRLNMLSFYKFSQRLTQTATFYPGVVIRRGSEAYTSKQCGACGKLNDDLGSNEVFECKSCGLKADRDLHAARNILLRHLT